jgi:hypothetical protein
VRALSVLASTLLLAACAQSAGSNGDPGARPLPPGQTCQSIRSELNGLDGKGVPSMIESRQAGRKLNPQQNAMADRYNELLNYYLGGRCHV